MKKRVLPFEKEVGGVHVWVDECDGYKVSINAEDAGYLTADEAEELGKKIVEAAAVARARNEPLARVESGLVNLERKITIGKGINWCGVCSKVVDDIAGTYYPDRHAMLVVAKCHGAMRIVTISDADARGNASPFYQPAFEAPT